jgi:hypothetical protein
VESIAGMFVDEINRGDPQSVLQLLVHELYNAGEFVKLGIRIPDLKAGGVYPGRRRKKLAILTAQNPATSADAKFTSTLELDAAVDNRLLKVNFGNAASSAGTTLWLEEEPADPHQELLGAFSDLAGRYLGIDRGVLAGVGTDWLSLYAWLADPTRTDKPILYTALELADVLICALGGSLARAYEHEREVVRRWTAELGIKALPELDFAETERAKKLQELLKTFKVPVIFRDIVQIKKLADVLATLQSLREALQAAKPVETYLKLAKFVSVREIAGATALLARSKQTPRSPSPAPLVNEVLLQYRALTEKYLQDVGYLPARFDRRDPNQGLKRLALAKAARDAGKRKNGAAELAQRIVHEAGRLTRHASATEEIGNILISKTVADLLTLAGFLLRNESALDGELAGAGADPFGAIARFYARRRKEFAAVLPDIFQHRIQRTLGC